MPVLRSVAKLYWKWALASFVLSPVQNTPAPLHRAGLLVTWVFTWAMLVVPVMAQPSLDTLLSQIESVLENETATTEDLEAALAMAASVRELYPSSAAAKAFDAKQTYGVIDLATLRNKLDMQSKVVGFFAAPSHESDLASQSIEICIETALLAPLTSELTLGVELNEQGHIQGIPSLLDPTRPTRKQRIDFFHLGIALENCALSSDYAKLEESLSVMSFPDGRVKLPRLSAPAQIEPEPLTATQIVPTSEGVIVISDDVVLTDPETFRHLPTTSAETQIALNLDKAKVRDIQARLLVLGFDPNGVDGVAGGGTRAAVELWQVSLGVTPTGYFNTETLALLKYVSESKLAAWLQDPENLKLHTPPAPIALTAARIIGSWSYTSTCRSHRINGAFTLRHDGGNRYFGRLRNSRGDSGNLSAVINGRSVTATVDFFGIFSGKVSMQGRVADQSLTISGVDSNRCRFWARKR